jgi:hypothetical protein
MPYAGDDDSLFSDIVSWLRQELRLSAAAQLKSSTRINIDLGVAGDDGVELIEAFGVKYNVDVTQFPYARYFGGEASANPLSVLRSAGRVLVGKSASGLDPLSVLDLVSLAKGSTAASPGDV